MIDTQRGLANIYHTTSSQQGGSMMSSANKYNKKAKQIKPITAFDSVASTLGYQPTNKYVKKGINYGKKKGYGRK